MFFIFHQIIGIPFDRAHKRFFPEHTFVQGTYRTWNLLTRIGMYKQLHMIIKVAFQFVLKYLDLVMNFIERIIKWQSQVTVHM
jgi:hypothetical protein